MTSDDQCPFCFAAAMPGTNCPKCATSIPALPPERYPCGRLQDADEPDGDTSPSAECFSKGFKRFGKLVRRAR